MDCKFHAAMRNLTLRDHPSVPRRRFPATALFWGSLLALASLPTQAEKADRFKELTVEADHSSSGRYQSLASTTAPTLAHTPPIAPTTVFFGLIAS